MYLILPCWYAVFTFPNPSKKLNKIGVRLLPIVFYECECHFEPKTLIIIQSSYYTVPEGEERLTGTEAIFE